MLWLNYIAAVLLLLAIAAKYISPLTFWPLAFAGISYPVLLLLNFLFVIWWGIQLRGWAVLSAALMLASLPNLLGIVHFSFTSKQVSNTDIKVMNYNSMLFDLYNWSHNRRSRKLIFETLVDESPDILCLQEFYTSEHPKSFNNADTLVSFLKTKNLHAEYTTTLRQTDHWGIATLTKYPILRKGKIAFNTRSNNICIYTDVLIAGDTVRIYNAHLASISFGKKEYKFIDDLNKSEYNDTNLTESRSIVHRLKNGFLARAAQVELIAASIRACPYKIIFCGDINDTPSSFAYHILSQKLSDTFKERGNGIGKTYNGSIPWLRIDYILHSPGLECLSYSRLPQSLTDHFPITSYLRVKK